MKPLAFSPLAQQDLESIFTRIAADKPNVAVQFVEKIEQQCRLLACHPALGARQEDLAKGLRVYVYRGYAIYYRDLDHEVRVERLLAPGVNVDRHWFPLP